MYIKPMWDSREFDVFVGHGWENWIRVKVVKNSCVIVKTNVDNIDPATLRLIYFKVKKKFFHKPKESIVNA